MADKLRTLMGVVPRQYQLSLVGIPSATLSVPIGMASAAALAPAAGVWLEVVNVTGAGRLRGAILSALAAPGWGSNMSLRITIDGISYDGVVTLGTSDTAYVLPPEMFVGGSPCLLADMPFSKHLQIDVRRDTALVPAMTLRYFYQLEA